MVKIKPLLTFLIWMPVAFSQTQLNGLIELPQRFSCDFINGNFYSQTSIHFGLQLAQSNQEIAFYGILQFAGDLYANYDNQPSNYTMKNLSIGAGINYRFFGNEKKISPIINTAIMTEIYSNYVGGYIDYDLTPRKEAEYHFGDPSNIYYYTWYYVSTPIIASFSAGFDYTICKNFSVNTTVGYGLRFVNHRSKYWDEGEPEPEANVSSKYSLTSSPHTLCHMLDIHLGLSYTFPFKKKE